MALEQGQLIFANFTAKVKDTGEGIDSTLEAEAKKLNIYDPGQKYEARLVAVGEGWVMSGLDEELKKMDVGEKKVIEIPPEKAYGKRDPSQTRMVPLRKFGEREHDLEVGDSVELDNRVGIVRFIGSGRAQVDFNHRLAGKSITYDFEVLSKVEADKDKVRALIDRRLGGDATKAEFEMAGDDLRVTIPPTLFLAEGLQIIKKAISTDVFKFVPRVASVAFVENYKNEKAEPKKVAPKAKQPAVVTKATKRPRRKAPVRPVSS